jgi:hypothetical protein
MNKTLQGLVLGLLTSSAVFGAQQNARTFIAHRDELANRAMEWTTSNHLARKECKTCTTDKNGKSQCKSVSCAGATVTVTPFYEQSTNSADLAYRFGQASDTTSEIKVYTGLPTTDTFHKWLFGVNVQQSPNSDGVTAGYSPMSGVLKFAPRRQVYGAHLGWNQSLDSLVKGLSLNVRAPLVQVRNSMRATAASSVASDIPAVDGASGKKITDYFAGNLSTSIGTHSHVSQAALQSGIIDAAFHTATGVGDVEARLDWDCCAWKKVSFGIGAGIQIPTGNKPSQKHMFEPIYGARGHVGAGMNGAMHIDAYANNNITVGLDMLIDWKYFFKGTESRMMGVYDSTNKAMVVNSQYRNVMRNTYSGVQPAANILVADHDVTPGHQIDGMVGLKMEWKNFTFDLGYNVYWHEAEKLALKSEWKNDTYAFAHNHYSMFAGADGLGTWVVGGGSFLDGDEDINHKGGVLGEDPYNDTLSSIQKSSNLIGANRDDWGPFETVDPVELRNLDPARVSFGDLDANKGYPGASTSTRGPIQASGITTSKLDKLNSTFVFHEFLDNEGDGSTVVEDGDYAGKQKVNFNITSDVAATESQLTHSVFGGISYKIKGACPMILGVGAKGEFQEKSRNSALEGFSIWTKFGISF